MPVQQKVVDRMIKTSADSENLFNLYDYAHAVANALTCEDLFHAAERAAQSLIGHQLFTIMAFDPDRMEVQRCFSSDPIIYPTGGRKKKRNTEWGHHVLERGKFFIGTSEENIRRYFDDHEVITSLGLCAVLNIPIKRLGKVIGTMNLLDETAHYTELDSKVGSVIAMGLSDAMSGLG